MTPSTRPRTTTLRPGRRPASVHSDNALQRVYDRGGPELLRRVLVALRDAYDGDPMAFESVVDDLGLVFDLYTRDRSRGPRLRPSQGPPRRLRVSYAVQRSTASVSADSVPIAWPPLSSTPVDA